MSSDTKTLSDLVLFESDRTCCICRDKAKPVVIHHIDLNHSNDERSNMSVVCDICHKLAHTDVPFSRNLTPEQVRLYDKSWREICAARLMPDSPQEDQVEYRQEVILEVTLACHGWKNSYMALYPGHFANVEGSFTDVWEMLLESGSHVESPEAWSHYRPLFQEGIDRVVNDLQHILACHTDALPVKLKTLVLRTIRQLLTEGAVYFMLGPSNTSIKSRVGGVLNTLSNLARTAESHTSASPVVHWRE